MGGGFVVCYSLGMEPGLKLSHDSPFLPMVAERILLETPNCLAFLDKRPLAGGHALVIPRRRVGSIYDLDEAGRADVWDAVRRVRSILAAHRHPAGPAAGQILSHTRVHVIPSYPGDVPDPRGGIRWIMPGKAKCWKNPSTSARISGS